MIVTTGPLTAAGMPLQRVPDGFLARRMRDRMPTVAQLHAENCARPQATADQAAAALAAIERATAAAVSTSL